MAKFKKGDVVVQKMHAPIEGVVHGFVADQETGELLLKVQYPAEDGSVHERHFKEDEFEAKAV